jgi:hypothetical protein
MGIKSKFNSQGSVYAYGATTVTPTNSTTPSLGVAQSVLATNQSSLHASPTNSTPGYSLIGNNATTYQATNAAYNSYLDGVPNNLPNASTLDLNGTTPAFTNSGNPLNPNNQALPYISNFIPNGN